MDEKAKEKKFIAILNAKITKISESGLWLMKKT